MSASEPTTSVSSDEPSSTALAVVAAGFGVVVYRLAGGGPALAPVALLCGAVVLAVALRP